MHKIILKCEGLRVTDYEAIKNFFNCHFMTDFNYNFAGNLHDGLYVVFEER